MANVQHTGGTPHGSFKDYVIGFVVSIILTVIPFFLVMFPDVFGFNSGVIILCITLFGLTQVLVHLVFFLHMNSSSDQAWNVVSLLFTIFCIVFFIGGSIWIMRSMHFYMMIG